jgi:hypothetical protein
MSEEIKSCPFCGSNVVTLERCVDDEMQETELFYIQCDGCLIATDNYHTALEAVKKLLPDGIAVAGARFITAVEYETEYGDEEDSSDE